MVDKRGRGEIREENRQTQTLIKYQRYQNVDDVSDIMVRQMD